MIFLRKFFRRSSHWKDHWLALSLTRVIDPCIKNYKNLNIRSKLNCGFGVLILLTFLVVVLSYRGSLEATRNVSRTNDLRVPTTLASASAQANLLRMLSYMQGYLATGEADLRERYQQNRHLFEKDLGTLNTLLNQQQKQRNRHPEIEKLQKVYQNWSILPDRLFDLQIDSLENQPALRLLDEKGELPILVILTEIDQILKQQRQKAVSEGDLSLLQALTDFKGSFSLMVADLRSYLVTRNSFFRFEYTAQSKTNDLAWKDLLDRRTLLNSAQKKSLEKIARARQEFLTLVPEIFELVNSDRYREDLFLFRTQFKPLADEMLTILDEIVVEQNQALTSELQQSNQSLRISQWQILIASFLALGIGSGMAIILYRQIAAPVTRLTDFTTRIMQGDFTARATVESRDEIGRLADTFNQMTSALSQSQQELKNYSHDLEQKTLELQDKNEQLETTLIELQKTHAQLIQTEKMSSLGQLVAGVAHEINNPVNFIHGNIHHLNQYMHSLIDLLKLYEKLYEEKHQDAAVVIQNKIEEIDLDFLQSDMVKILSSMTVGTRRIQEIVTSLRTFSRLDEAEFKEADIHEGINSALMILNSRLKQQPDRPEIHVIKHYGNLPLVECYAGQLNQVFMNILVNAIDALEESSRFSVLSSQLQARSESDDEAYNSQKPTQNSKLKTQNSKTPTITIRTTVLASNWISISIKDNGPGISAIVQKRLFDPFFTTKRVGEGTGLGLSISYQIIVEKHGGKLTCISQPGEGAEFLIQIPRKQTS